MLFCVELLLRADMFQGFQRIVATGKFTLPIVSVVCIAIWLTGMNFSVLGINAASSHFTDEGLWCYVPLAVKDGLWGRFLGLMFTAVAVYLMAELNNSNVLLRINSRLISSLLAVLCTLCTFLHCFQPCHIVLIFVILAYFELFYTYQDPNLAHSFMVGGLFGLGSLVFPKLILFVPCVWIAQAYLRALTPKTFFASVVGILTPYWFLAAVLALNGSISIFVEHSKNIVDFAFPDYRSVPAKKIIVTAYIFLLFIVGAIDFYCKSYLDKTKTRIIHKAVILLGFMSFIFIALQTQYIDSILPLAIVNTSIVAGHNIALTYNRFMNIYTIAISVIAIVLVFI